MTSYADGTVALVGSRTEIQGIARRIRRRMWALTTNRDSKWPNSRVACIWKGGGYDGTESDGGQSTVDRTDRPSDRASRRRARNGERNTVVDRRPESAMGFASVHRASVSTDSVQRVDGVVTVRGRKRGMAHLVREPSRCSLALSIAYSFGGGVRPG